MQQLVVIFHCGCAWQAPRQHAAQAIAMTCPRHHAGLDRVNWRPSAEALREAKPIFVETKESRP